MKPFFRNTNLTLLFSIAINNLLCINARFDSLTSKHFYDKVYT